MAPPKSSNEDDPFSALNATEMRLLALGHIFHDQGAPNYEEMAKWSNLKASSASTLYRSAKRKLARALETAGAPTTSPTKAGPARKRVKKSTAQTAQGEVNTEDAAEESAAPVKDEPTTGFDDPSTVAMTGHLMMAAKTVAEGSTEEE
ncbi:uncharacterized protein N7511_006634 [Penicillium nucicola]|uniref:uncharacterized protein n=1 Tax=Penicillium nucicola TaxID=1850975 RepID=UPI00254591DA|nr:uncharacterized protein N7511_006634 [Penicillium nucicola]KAJ5757940.1 hypothetical protein N7511_006634 [Penicillium nucicola]